MFSRITETISPTPSRASTNGANSWNRAMIIAAMSFRSTSGVSPSLDASGEGCLSRLRNKEGRSLRAVMAMTAYEMSVADID